jgi:hypothetical protein
VLIPALLVGGLTAYWFGLRAGGWAAVATLALCLVAAVVPVLARPIHLVLAAAVVGVCLLGPRRERPPDAVRAVKAVRMAFQQLKSRWGSRSDRRNGHRR